MSVKSDLVGIGRRHHFHHFRESNNFAALIFLVDNKFKTVSRNKLLDLFGRHGAIVMHDAQNAPPVENVDPSHQLVQVPLPDRAAHGPDVIDQVSSRRGGERPDISEHWRRNVFNSPR